MHSEDLTPLRLHLTVCWQYERSFSPHMEQKQHKKRWHSCALPNVKLLLGFTWTLCLKIVANRRWIWSIREILTNVAPEHQTFLNIWNKQCYEEVCDSAIMCLFPPAVHWLEVWFMEALSASMQEVVCSEDECHVQWPEKKRLIPQLHYTPWKFMLHPVRIQPLITVQNNMQDSNEGEKYACRSVSLLLLEWESD